VLENVAGLSSPTSPSKDNPENDQKQDGANGCRDDGGDNANAKVDAQPWQQPTAYQSADNPNGNVSDETKAGASHDLAGKPSSDKANQQNDEETFT
jgi:hypothetical protein